MTDESIGLKALEAERDIRALVAHYSLYADLGRSEDYAALFSPDGEIQIGLDGLSSSPGEVLTVRGRDEIIAFMTGPMSGNVARRIIQHHVSGQLGLQLDGDVAHGFSYSFVIKRDGDSLVVSSANSRSWSFSLDASGGHIKSVRVLPLGACEVDEMMSQF